MNFLFICLRPTEPGNFTHITFLISISPKPETNNPRFSKKIATGKTSQAITPLTILTSLTFIIRHLHHFLRR